MVWMALSAWCECGMWRRLWIRPRGSVVVAAVALTRGLRCPTSGSRGGEPGPADTWTTWGSGSCWTRTVVRRYDIHMDVLTLPVALITCDDGVARIVPVDIAPDGAVVFRGTDAPIDMVSLVELFEDRAPVVV